MIFQDKTMLSRYEVFKFKRFVKTLIMEIGIFFISLSMYSCAHKDIFIENYGMIEKQDVINIENYTGFNDLVAYKTGFVKNEKRITYIDDSYIRVNSRCIKKIDGIEYLFDDTGYLAKGTIVEDVSYPMQYPINDYYSRLADEKGVYISEKGVYEVGGKKYFVDKKGEVKTVWEKQIVVYDGKFYKGRDSQGDFNNYELMEISDGEIYDIYDYVNTEDRSLQINDKSIRPEEYREFDKEQLIEIIIQKYDLKKEDKYIYQSPAIIKDDEEEKIGFHNIEYNDYRTKGLDDIYWINYDDVTKGKIYLKSNNKYALDEIIKMGSKRYLFDMNNLLVENNVYTIGNKTYLSDKDGVIIEKEGIYKIINVKDNEFKRDLYSYEMNFYVNKNGLVEKNKFIEYNGNIYYASFDGNLYKNKYKQLLYFNDDCKLDKETFENNKIDFEEVNKKEYFNAINNIKESSNKTIKERTEELEKEQKELLKKEYIANNNFNIKLNDKYIELKEFENYNLSDIVRDVSIEDKNGNILKNKFVSLGYKVSLSKIDERAHTYNYKHFDYYIDNEGKIVYDKIIEINNKKYIFDIDGKQVKNVWLFDYDYYKDENKKSDINPYIIGYRVKRDLIKEYLGYYVADYLLTDNIEIENSFMYHALQDAEDSNAYDCYLVKNGKYNHSYDYRFKGGEAFRGMYEKERNYQYVQIDEGVFKYIHNKKCRLNEATDINENNITEQLSRYSVYDSKFNFSDDETVKFGAWYTYDKTGKSKDKLRWHILKKSKNRALLITEDIIDVRPFHNNDEDVSWSDSDLRKWLNDIFYNEAFSEEEKKYIYNYKITDDLRFFNDNFVKKDDDYIRVNNLGKSNDKVFLLSLLEMIVYFNTATIDKQVLYPSLSRYAENKYKNISNNECNDSICSYWTRNTSSKNGENRADSVDEKGNYNYSYKKVNNDLVGVRPVIWVKYNNKDNDEYGKNYSDKEDLYYQYILNKKDAYVNDEWNANKEDLSKQIEYCKTLTDYNDDEVIEETDHILFGTYEMDGVDNGKEEIKWTLLDKDEENGRALFVSKYIIDAKHYNEEGGDATWETSSIRKWLNKDFFNDAFNDIEKDLIEETVVHTNDESEIISDTKYTTRGGNDTKDKIFLLSTDEIKKYMWHNKNFVLTTITENVNKNVNANRYLYKNSGGWIEKYDDRVYYSSYMTRSPGYFQNSIKTVNPLFESEELLFNSNYAGSMIQDLSFDLDGVRPAMWVKYK